MSKTFRCKRKRDKTTREFQDSWTTDYLFIEWKQKPLCLICGATLSISKDFNMKRHYNALHQHKYDKTVGKLREDLVEKLRNSLGVQQSVFKKPIEKNENAITASYVVAEKAARYLRPITDGEFARECIQDIAKPMFPKQAHLFEKISLSRTTIARRIEEIGENISEQLQSKADTFQYFSLAFDESCDMSDTAQLSIFIRVVAKDLSVHEDLVGLISFHDTTRGVEIVLNALHYEIPNLSLSKLVGLTTDGTASMTGKENRAVALLKKYLQESDFTQDIITFLWFIHQESLCAQSIKMTHVMDVVEKCVNEIRAKELKHRQFQSFLLEMNTQYKDLVYHSQARWLSRGKVLQCFLSLLEEIKIFLLEKSPTLKTKSGADVLTLLRDNSWLVDLTYST